MTKRKFTAYSVMVGTILCGGGALLLLVYFLFVGPVSVLRVPLSNAGRLGWDIVLSLLFCGVHSVLVRRTVRGRLTKLIPEHYYTSMYAVISGILLILVVLLWQPTDDVWIRLEGGLAWLPRGVALFAVVGFAWIIRSLRGFGMFDMLGRRAIRAYLRGKCVRPAGLLIRGPYRHVRHPLYALMIVLLWSTPTVTSDRVLLNALWTGWIMVGAFLEERDLVVAFGATYREYQGAVPMLVPWHLLAQALQKSARGIKIVSTAAQRLHIAGLAENHPQFSREEET